MTQPADPVADLAWLSGTWRTESGAEEWWIPPRGGLMLGVHRKVREGRATFWEQLRIEHLGDGLVDYVAWPKGQAVTHFRMTQSRPGSVMFENPTHDFPRRIQYTRTGDTLDVRVEGESGGTPREASWRFTRV